MGKGHNASMNPAARRRSQRVLMQVAVRIRGEDVQGQTIEEETQTLAINAHGALVLMKARVTSGTKVLLQHKGTQEEQECLREGTPLARRPAVASGVPSRRLDAPVPGSAHGGQPSCGQVLASSHVQSVPLHFASSPLTRNSVQNKE